MDPRSAECNNVPRSARLRAVRGTLRIDAMTAEVVQAFHEADIESILLKGPTFASLLYPDGGRNYADSDLLVRRVDVPAAQRVLTGLGFLANQAGYAASERDHESSTFTRREPPGVIDLHWNVHLAADPDITWRVLSDERDELTLGGTQVAILNVPARALHVALHAAQHGLHGPQRFDRGGQTGDDLRRALRIVERRDWEKAQSLASALGAEESFAYGLRLDTEGTALADELGLTRVTPELWRYRNPFQGPRGASSFRRLMAAPTVREKASVAARAALPSRARVRRVADSRIGRGSLVGAYLEYWADALRGLGPAIRSGIVLHRATRRVRD